MIYNWLGVEDRVILIFSKSIRSVRTKGLKLVKKRNYKEAMKNTN